MTETYQSDLMMDVGSAHEIKLAARKAGFTPADLKRLSSGDTLAKILPVLLGFSTVVPLVKFKPWRKISIQGKHLTGEQHIKNLQSAGVRCTDYAKAHVLARDYPIIEKDRHFEVFCQTAEELGFQSPMNRFDIIKRLSILSFKPCPDDLALYLLCAEPTLMNRSLSPIHVAMNPWMNKLKAFVSLSLAYETGKSVLQVLYDEAAYKYHNDSAWMFVRETGPS